MYALHKKCIVERQEKTFSQMVMQNHSKCKIAESVPVPELKDKILQICHSSGRLALERMERVDGGILVEGTLHINFLYVKQDDEPSRSQEPGCPLPAPGSLPGKLHPALPGPGPVPLP